MSGNRVPIVTVSRPAAASPRRSGVVTIRRATPAGSSLELELLARINEYRQRQGYFPLQESVELGCAARDHSTGMRDLGFFAHEDPFRCGPADRVLAANYGPYLVVGENIAMGTQTPAATLQAWIDSPPHHALLLDRRITEAGVGLAEGQGLRYWTLNCARPLPRPQDGLRRLGQWCERLRAGVDH